MADAPDGAAHWERRVQVRLARGEAAALGELYDRHARLVHAIAARLIGEEKAATSVMTEVFTRLWQHPEAFDPRRQRLRTWLAMETCERAAERVKADDAAATAPPQRLSAPEQASGRRAAYGRPEETAADEALGALGSRVRAALHLVRHGDRDYRQAAGELGMTEEEILRCLLQGLQSVADATGTGPEGGHGARTAEAAEPAESTEEAEDVEDVEVRE
ncbi:sigma factor [Streptomyces sp. NPDC046985]|uniref:sigma factor n=1 Tax=Streptomyces sp. NPDC046985 TaxID=3155377 RepID=UPI0033D70FE2